MICTPSSTTKNSVILELHDGLYKNTGTLGSLTCSTPNTVYVRVPPLGNSLSLTTTTTAILGFNLSGTIDGMPYVTKITPEPSTKVLLTFTDTNTTPNVSKTASIGYCPVNNNANNNICLPSKTTYDISDIQKLLPLNNGTNANFYLSNILIGTPAEGFIEHFSGDSSNNDCSHTIVCILLTIVLIFIWFY